MKYQVRYAFKDDDSEYTAVVNDLPWQDKQDRFELLAELRHPAQWAKRYNLDYVEFEEAVE